jgi:hypothetical protein
VDFFASGITPQTLVDFHPLGAAQQRALELLELAKEGQSTPEQEFELEHFTELKTYPSDGQGSRAPNLAIK